MVAVDELPLDVRAQIRTQVVRLAEDFRRISGTKTIQRFVDETLQRWPKPKVIQHLPLLTYGYTKERLRAFGISEGKISKDRPEVLFVCIHNAGRSQMAAGLLAKHAKGQVTVRSAGSTPSDEINPAVVLAMAEVGVDLSQEYPKPLSDEFVQAADVVITMGCGTPHRSSRASVTRTGTSTIHRAGPWTSAPDTRRVGPSRSLAARRSHIRLPGRVSAEVM